MRKTKEHPSNLDKKVPPWLAIPLILMIAGLSVNIFLINKSNNEARATLRDVASTLTSIVATSHVVEATRAEIIQKTATAAPINAMHPDVKAAMSVIYPTESTACSQTILRVGQVDTDHNINTLPDTVVQTVSILHCLQEVDSDFSVQIGQDKVDASLINILPLGPTPQSNSDEADPMGSIIYSVGSQYYESLSHLDGLVQIQNGTNLELGTGLSYCGYNGYANVEAFANGLPPSLKCDITNFGGYDPDGFGIMNPAAVSGGDSGGAVTLAGTTTQIGVVSSSENTNTVGPQSTTSFFAPVPQLGDNMIKIQWDTTLASYEQIR